MSYVWGEYFWEPVREHFAAFRRESVNPPGATQRAIMIHWYSMLDVAGANGPGGSRALGSGRPQLIGAHARWLWYVLKHDPAMKAESVTYAEGEAGKLTDAQDAALAAFDKMQREGA